MQLLQSETTIRATAASTQAVLAGKSICGIFLQPWEIPGQTGQTRTYQFTGLTGLTWNCSIRGQRQGHTRMVDFLLRIQHSGFCQWVRQSDSIFSYSGILLLHTIGMGFVVGINACIDLRILGFAPALRLAGMEKFFPVLWAGFWVNAATGTILLAIDLVDKLSNVDFYIKLVFIALAIVCLQMTKTHVFRDPLIDKAPSSSKAKMLAVLSLIFWIGAITSGRLLAYVGPGSGAK